ncbi:light-harvesting protein B-800-850 alpha chain [Rhodoblastus acidophilus]|uniref:Light-harvesting protein B-800-850 alpha chain n=1 Tax=Rhodoblastus acidophilus TaxID=1074 RepID=Q52654_RHOAC|nr:light-harvesting protein [Rhodoblastus acidophilus]MCW2315212.1 light-harvesting protein B-800-850 alpha chain [Rhodoblastus acidophilus]PPQ38392.1 light-harvesting protein [Rhodoblastus acidophilus]RAI20065.1 light-harvesting protein [Rhodoblastus acidophilus]CAA87719.1 puc4A [Rhodoblastus acidophilus]SNB77180.1 light-harvesting protein B-800-850 alpha chain [Rhodoblastus acidophilus]
MNQGKIWTVVNPSVGLPLLLGSVTVIAILVHLAVLSNTKWFPAYWQGGLKKAAAIETTIVG